jgi:hypothetical protein
MRSLLAPSAKPHASIYAPSRVLLAAGFGKIDNPPLSKASVQDPGGGAVYNARNCAV